MTHKDIHGAFIKARIAAHYYAIKGRNYEFQHALRQFRQDKAIDKKIVSKVISQIFKEQKEMLKKT
jgi:hypothetical protein